MSSLAVSDRLDAPIFSDGLGERVVAPDGTTGELLQVLRLRPAIVGVPSFEFALRERTARLANFRHAYYSRVRRIDRAMTPGSMLSVVSEHIEGVRLSEILRVAQQRDLRLDTNAALCLLRQLVPALAVLHENARDVAHGLIAPERLLVTPNARLVVVEHVLGAAIEQLQYTRDRLWQEFRAGLPATAGRARFDHRADVNGIGLVALALLLGRPLDAADFPQRIPVLVTELRDGGARRGEPGMAPALLGWLTRALQLDPRRSFASAPEAMTALESVWIENPSCVPSPVALETFLSRYLTALLEPVSVPVPPLPLPAPIFAPAELHEDTASRSVQQNLAGIDETLPAAEAPVYVDTEPPAPRSRTRLALLAGAAVLVLAGGGWQVITMLNRAAAPPPPGVLAIQSNPPGAMVVIDGVERGATPARISLPPGPHILELRGRGVPRAIPITVTSGVEVSQYLEFPEAPLTGQLAVETQPPGAKVTIDGQERGVAPVTIPDLAPGEHTVVLQAGEANSRHTVTVQSGATVSLVIPLAAAAGPVSGWISVKVPFTIEVREGGRLLGTSDTDRIMMAAGRHELEFVSEPMGYRATHVVQVPPGKVAPFSLDLPQGSVNLNATPWAEVWLDGKRVGDTPIGNLAVPIGAHEIVFKHPQLGEKRQAISVTLNAPVRLSVDMK